MVQHILPHTQLGQPTICAKHISKFTPKAVAVDSLVAILEASLRANDDLIRVNKVQSTNPEVNAKSGGAFQNLQKGSIRTTIDKINQNWGRIRELCPSLLEKPIFLTLVEVMLAWQ